MGITINISGGGAAPLSGTVGTTGTAATTSAPLDAGASTALPSRAEAAGHPHGPESTFDGGAPASSLVQEVESALRKMRGGVQGAESSASVNATSAGGAPV